MLTRPPVTKLPYEAHLWLTIQNTVHDPQPETSCIRLSDQGGVPTTRQSSIRQAWQDLNPQPPLLESGALPIELHACASWPSERRTATSSLLTVPTGSPDGAGDDDTSGSTSSARCDPGCSSGSSASCSCAPCTHCTQASRLVGLPSLLLPSYPQVTGRRTQLLRRQAGSGLSIPGSS